MPAGSESVGSIAIRGERAVQQLGRGATAEYDLAQLKVAGFDPERDSGVIHVRAARDGSVAVQTDESLQQERIQARQHGFSR